jgi:serine/threonine-protein kinase
MIDRGSASDDLEFDAAGTGSVGGRLLLRSRLIAFHRFGFLLALALAVLLNVILLVRYVDDVASLFACPANLASFATVLCFAGLWVVVSQFELSLSALRRVDALGTVFICLLAVTRGCVNDLMQHSEFTSVLAISNVLVFRAVVIPGPPLRTFWIGLASIAPLILAVLLQQFRGDGADGPFAATLMGEHAPLFVLWAAVSVTVSTAATAVIYGLRRKVTEARRLGQYTLEEKLGEGAMGEVYRARHALLRRPTAVKLVKPDAASNEVLRRFEREVQLTASLTHPNTIAIYDYGRTPDEVFYYAMEYLDGLDLQTLINETGPLPPARVIHVVRQIAASLSEAHEMGLIHRDVKPANVILCRRGGVDDTVKVVDFGLVKDVSSDPLDRTLEAGITGTPLYLSPESIRSPGEVDGRSDLYALGVLGYQLLTGRPPFDATNIGQIVAHHLQSVPPRPSERLGRALPRDLEDVLLACLEKSPADRPHDARAVIARLDACADAHLWTNTDAAEWWRAHREGPRVETPSRPSPVRESVMAVRLDATR